MSLFRVIPQGDLDLVLNPETGKRELLIITGAAYVRQKIATRFKFFLGEWFLDQREGVPYFREIFVKNPDIDIVRAIFRRVLTSVVEVSTITRFDLAYDPVTRTLSFDFAVTLRTGEELVVTPSDRLFIIDVPLAA